MSDKVDDKHIKEAISAEDNLKLEEINRGYRIVYFNEDHFLARRHGLNSIRIYDKSILAISHYGDDLLTRTRNRLMRDEDMVTYEEQMRILEKRGIWNDKMESELVDLRSEAKKLQEDRDRLLSLLNDSKDKKKTADYKKQELKLVDMFKEVYIKYFELNRLNQIHFMDTIELQSQMAQRKGWIVSSVCKNEGDDEWNPDMRVWNAVSDLDKDLRDEDLELLLNECTLYWEFGGRGGESFFVESPEELKSGSNSEAPKN